MTIDGIIDSGVRCINQVFRPRLPFRIEGMGDCLICTYDPENNGHCVCYSPIHVRIHYFEVKEKETTEKGRTS